MQMWTKKLILILLLCSICQAAQIIRYVDPDVAAGDSSGDSWENAYVSLFAWEAAEQTDLDTANNYMTVYCRSSAGTPDTTNCTIDGFTTSATDYVEIIGADFPTDGIYDATKYVKLNTSEGSSSAILVSDQYIHIRNIQVRTVVSTTAAIGHGISVIITNSSIDSCIIKGEIASDAGVCVGIALNAANTIIYDSTISGFKQGLQVTGSAASAIYNCTFWDCSDIAIYAVDLSITATNCIIGRCGFDTYGSVTVDYCLSEKGTGTNAQVPLGIEAIGSVGGASPSLGNYTQLDFSNPATGTGVITEALVGVATQMTNAVFGSFYLVSGTTYKCRDSEAIGTIPIGTRLISGLSINVESGDVIGMYWSTGGYIYYGSGGTATASSIGDHSNPDDEAVYNVYGGQHYALRGYIVDWSDELTDPGTDFSLVVGSNSIGNGTDNPGSGLYSDDIIGTARTSTWDIGAFEYLAPATGGGQLIMIQEF